MKALSVSPLTLRVASLLTRLVATGRSIPVPSLFMSPGVSTSAADDYAQLRRVLGESVQGLAEALEEERPARARSVLDAVLVFAITPLVLTGHVLTVVPAGEPEKMARQLAGFIPDDPDVVGSMLLDVQTWLAQRRIRDGVLRVATELEQRPDVSSQDIVEIVIDALGDQPVTLH